MEKKAWPYMAGIMDAEGSISISISRKSTGYESFNLSIQCSNTNRRLIDWVVSNFGGSFCTEIKKNSFTPGSKIFRWTLYGRENQDAFLLGIIPFLVIKKNQAVLSLCFLQLGWGDNDKRRILWEKMKSLNVNEVPVPPQINRFVASKAAAYVAGYLDGDGSICGTYARGQNISIASTDFIEIKWLLTHFGGKFYTRVINGKKPIHFWTLSGSKNKERFLLDVMPHLVLKKDQAKILLELVRLRRLDEFGKNKAISEQVEKLNNKIRQLNSGSVEGSATTETLSAS